MEIGRVKSFDIAKGYGWIVPNEGARDLYVSQRNILGDDIKDLPIDAIVHYESRTNAKGLEAYNVSLSE
jgi:CspA family cold shock protein